MDSFESLKTHEAVLHLHFHPDIALTHLDDCTFSAGNALIRFEGAAAACIRNYKYAAGFNHLKNATCIEVNAAGDKLVTIIQIA